jgi:hypothetical protein
MHDTAAGTAKYIIPKLCIRPTISRFRGTEVLPARSIGGVHFLSSNEFDGRDTVHQVQGRARRQKRHSSRKPSTTPILCPELSRRDTLQPRDPRLKFIAPFELSALVLRPDHKVASGRIQTDNSAFSCMRDVSHPEIASFTAVGRSSMISWPPSMVTSVKLTQSSRIGAANLLCVVSQTVSFVA